ncbi:MAG: glycosyltransferase family 2 protein [Deltaproteobacteria bacterium]|nr:glycosyltransferase family 2 protein [Deltaproteobacteria bacterium]
MSVIVPFYNEVNSINFLARRLESVLKKNVESYELIFVDDGSNDGTNRILHELMKEIPSLKVIELRRNFGKATALTVGFQYSRGEMMITLDGDLQDQPEEIPRLIEKLGEGYDLVNGWKQVRKDPLSKKIPSRIFNFVVRVLTGLHLKDVCSGFKAYRRDCAKSLQLYGELHRFIPVLAHWQGFRIAEIPVRHDARKFDRTKYGMARFAKGFLDLLTVMLTTRFLARPLHLFGLAGLSLIATGIFILGYLSALWFLGYPIGSRPLLVLGYLLLMVGIQILVTGLLGELIIRSQGTFIPSHAIRTMSGGSKCVQAQPTQGQPGLFSGTSHNQYDCFS